MGWRDAPVVQDGPDIGDTDDSIADVTQNGGGGVASQPAVATLPNARYGDNGQLSQPLPNARYGDNMDLAQPMIAAPPRPRWASAPIIAPAPQPSMQAGQDQGGAMAATQPIDQPAPSFDYTAAPQNGAAGIFPVDQNSAGTYQQDVNQYLQTPGGVGMQQQRQRVPSQIQGGYDQVIAQPQGLPLTGSNAFSSTPGPYTAGMAQGESPLNRAARLAAQESGDPRYLEHAAMTMAMNDPALGADSPLGGLPDELTGSPRAGSRFMQFDPSDLPADFIQKSKENQRALVYCVKINRT